MTAIRISGKINPTESSDKVRRAINNVFGDIDLIISEETFMAELDGYLSLREFRVRIAQDKIRTTMKNVLTRWTNENRLSFGLNRQAAYAGHVSLNLQNEDPMGPIQVEVEGDIDELVTFLTS